jgi:threonine dehydrogenase-like Zn-dependent dehydrogenase
VATDYSVVSPGTERWLLTLAERANTPLGYMAIGRQNGERVLAPAPHGTWFDAGDRSVVMAPVAPELMAIARFQLMAASGLRPVSARVRQAARFAVVGTGPVAIGAVLEVLRASDAEVSVITRHPERAERLLGGLDRVSIAGYETLRGALDIIECTGQPENIAACIGAMGEGALLGILGSPRAVSPTDLYAIHRAGALLLGMHELAQFDVAWRRDAFREIATWLAALNPQQRDGWVASTPAADFARVYERLQRNQLAEPFQLLDWRGYAA